ncbi:hypothetical protein GCM10022239_00530 [Leifsonia bigeumensis]|uniref:DUF4232 domain-containing protein n=1 Tax=Leifsonella bigeumensis TaxID=433643 RepID=A0ABP7EZZ8_9MICO
MSTFRNPVGPQPSNVYWRRRLVVGLLLLAVIVIIILLFIQPRGETPKTPNVKETNSQSEAPTDPDAACAAGVVELEAVTDKSTYAAGENPMIHLTVTNTGATSCTINAGTTQQEYLITSGDELYWNSKDCQSDAVDAPVILEPNVPQSTNPIAWDRTRSSPTTCDTDRPMVPAGGASYHLNINLGDLKSNDVQFILN